MGDDSAIEERVKNVILEVLSSTLSLEEINKEAFFSRERLDLDSVATLEVLLGLEDEFGIEVRDEDLRVELFDSVKALADCVRREKGVG